MLIKYGIKEIGTKIKVENVEEEGISVEISGTKYLIPIEIAKTLYVDPVDNSGDEK